VFSYASLGISTFESYKNSVSIGQEVPIVQQDVTGTGVVAVFGRRNLFFGNLVIFAGSRIKFEEIEKTNFLNR